MEARETSEPGPQGRAGGAESPEVLRPEVLRSGEGAEAWMRARGAEDAPPTLGGGRLGHALAPLWPGIAIDLLDLVTFGPLGVALGWLVGAPAGWYLARRAGLAPPRAAGIALATAVYCTLPFTAPLPLATLVTLAARWMADERARDGEPPA